MFLCPFNILTTPPFQYTFHKLQMDREALISSILRGCALAKQLETNLPGLLTQPTSLYSSCDEVTTAFTRALELLNQYHPSFHGPIVSGAPQTLELSSTTGSQTQAMDLLYSHELETRNPFAMPSERPMLGALMGIADEEETSRTALRPCARDTHAFEELSPGRSGALVGSSTGQRGRRRGEGQDVRTVRVPAPPPGALEIPPDDGYTWRKYGQKEILNSNFPRSYYRCTHKSFYGCDAKKQVQRLDNDPSTFQVMYRGRHTCQTSPTPLFLPTLQTTERTPVSTKIHLGRNDSNAPADQHGKMRDIQVGEGSHVQGGGSVMDLAHVMFSSGASSTSDDMDAIFRQEQ